jgi:radical SAM superfamily enzyme YgiQ (UPF0313 family)
MERQIKFVHAPYIRYDQNYGTLFIPLWAYTLAAFVPESWEIEVVDTIVDKLADVGPADVFAFSGINQDIGTISAARDRLKGMYPDAAFVVGGPITWSFEQEGKLGLLDGFDHVFILDGEKTLPTFLNNFDAPGAGPTDRIIRAERFALSDARPIRFDLFERKVDSYYGAVVEVSRGCPFLCEFCDIRVLPGNNRSNNKDPALIVQEMDAHHKLGVTQFQFACDNFIGDIQWARQCVAAISEWRQKTGAKISIFTWLTINLYKLPDLMKAMREAGFSILFIGIESVNHNSLLETAKIQNCAALEEAVVEIQSYGFIIAPGFIFGFDSDKDTIFDETLDFMERTGMIGGDPSFLMALPGTPLFQRMKRTGRLIEDEQTPTIRMKITTNIRYLQDSDRLADGFMRFLARYNSPAFQAARFDRHLDNIINSGNFVPIDGVGYGSPVEYVKMQIGDADNRRMFFRRIGFLLLNPRALMAGLKARWRVAKLSSEHGDLGIHFNYWFYVWTNIVLKYAGLRRDDFELHSVDAEFDYEILVADKATPGELPKPNIARGDTKDAHQKRYTDQALQQLVEEHTEA